MKRSIIALAVLAFSAGTAIAQGVNTAPNSISDEKLERLVQQLSPAQRQKLKAMIEQPARATPRGEPVAATPVPRPQNRARQLEPETTSRSNFYLRRSFDDIGPFGAPGSVPLRKAHGALFSWSNDRVLDNRTLSANGIVAASWNYTQFPTDAFTPYLGTATFATFAKFDKTSNSRLVSRNIDNLALGTVLELGYFNFLQANHFISFKTDVVTAFDGPTRNWSARFEWQPIGAQDYLHPENNTLFSYLGNPLNTGPLQDYFVMQFVPVVRAEYRRRLEDQFLPIFVRSDEVMRVGPSLQFKLDTIGGTKLPGIIPRFGADVTYSYFYDTRSGLTYKLLAGAISFPLGDQDHFDLSLRYRRGEIEETGNRVDLTTLGLAVKF